MTSVWYRPELAEHIISHSDIFTEIHSIITDIVSGRLDIADLVENMAGVLTSSEAENREKGIRFYTKILKELPRNFLNDVQVKFISKFYIDRLKDHHRVVPPVIEGYSTLIDMNEYKIQYCTDFLPVLFREVSCQSQMRQDRYNIYEIIQKLCSKDMEFMKTLGSDFVYGVISAMDGERDPRNLVFLFSFLSTFIKSIPLGHLVDEMFDVISCYYPIDFHPSKDDPAALTREDLATALCPCLCAVPQFGDSCVILLIEKLDSNLRVAKIDSLKLLIESCKTFTAETYSPFLRALWSSINREMSNKTDDELKLVAHEALAALVGKMATTADTDQAFENFLKGILISAQTTIADATTVAQFVKGTKVLLTTANASDQSCATITRAMVPATEAYYEMKSTPKLQIASLDFIGDLYECAKNRGLLNEVRAQVSNVPQVCLEAVSHQSKEFQMAGFRTLIRVQDCLGEELVVPFVEVLIYNVQHAQDTDLLSISVETIHMIARKYPELIMNLVVKGKCNLDTIAQDKIVFQKRLNLLTNLASIDDFTKVIIEQMMKIILDNEEEALHVVQALSSQLSVASVFSNEKITQIESDHGLIEPVLARLYREISASSPESLAHGFTLIANTLGSLPPEKQQIILSKHTPEALERCAQDDIYFSVIESLYTPLHPSVYNSTFEEILTLALNMALRSENEEVRYKGCVVLAHLLNKAEHGQKFELLYESFKSRLSVCDREDAKLCPRLILLYGWITKALLLRGSEIFLFWLQKIIGILSTEKYCSDAAEAIKLIMSENPEYLNPKQHCRISLLYKQRMFQTFSGLSDNLKQSLTPETKESYLLSWAYVLEKAPKTVLKNEATKRMFQTFSGLSDNLKQSLTPETKESYLLSWAYVLEKAPKTVLKNEATEVAPIVIDSLAYDNKAMLIVSLDVLCQFIQANPESVVSSLQTILPRLISLTKYMKSMDVRIKSLECLYEIANNFRTSILLPHKQDILLDLAPSLDDKKRLVRSVAVRARSRWFLVGAPGEEKDN